MSEHEFIETQDVEAQGSFIFRVSDVASARASEFASENAMFTDVTFKDGSTVTINMEPSTFAVIIGARSVPLADDSV